jgi:lysozyme family protein
MSFDQSFNRIIGHEGGYSNDPNDAGGETNWGISKRSYPNEDIKNLTKDQAKAIYLRDFWMPIKAEFLPDGVGFQLFDFALNSGIRTAVRAYQRALGVVDDGVLGPVSLRVSTQMPPAAQIMGLLSERLYFMASLKSWKHFNKGWARRIAGNLKYGAQVAQ